METWRELAANRDFAAARAAWDRVFAGPGSDPAPLWQLAELEERWGDSIFFAGEPGAVAHYHAALRAAVPPNAQFTSREENDRRMEAHARIFEKIRAIGPDGQPRDGYSCLPHPDGGLTPERIASLRHEKAEREAGRHRAAALKERLLAERAAAAERQQSMRPAATGFARLYLAAGHWGHYSLATQWRAAGSALADAYPDIARAAFDWSIYYFGEYNAEWTRGLPASRWDSDGGAEIMEVQQMEDALGAGSAAPPEWINHLAAGAWIQALAAFGADPPGPEFIHLVALLAGACDMAGKHEDAERLRQHLPAPEIK